MPTSKEDTRDAAPAVARVREPLQNELSWSRSRAQLFEQCPRQYYYAYYASWGGWEADCDPRARRLYVLKQLKTRHMWAGEVVHQIVERALRDLQRGIRKPRVDEVVANAQARMRRDFSTSRAKLYHERPKTTALYEHEYEIPVQDGEWKELADHVGLCLRNVFASDVYRKLGDFQPDDYLEIENLSTCSVAGVRVWVKLDVALKAGSGVVIIDWKTGLKEADEIGRQLACYALYCGQRWGVEPRQVQALVYNLALGEQQTYEISQDAVTRARTEIVDSIESMRSYLSDPELNVPLEEDAFPLAADERPCRRCNFRSECPRFQVS